jgi:superoxide reductase
LHQENKTTIKTIKKTKIMTTRFYKCEMCGNVVVKLVDSKVPIVCCGQKMQELVPNTVDASNEKHVPVVTRLENNTIKVEVGSVAHPMTEEHHIAFIYVETDKGGVKVDLSDKPEAVIALGDAKPIAVYEYCNLHGLWKTEL